MTTGRRLARNSLLNLGGNLAPMLVALVAVPVLLRGLGPERFGILSLGWAFIGYFGYFDLGLGRALTRLVSEHLDDGDQAALDRLVWTALRLIFALGLGGWLVAYLLTPWLVHGALRISAPLQGEALWAFYVMAASVPAVVVTSGLRGVLEAYQRFDLVNAVRVPLGVLNFAGPLAVLPFTHRLPVVLTVLLASRILGVALHLALCFVVMPSLRGKALGRSSPLGPLVRTGGWFTVSNVVSPLMGATDRFFIGAIISAAAVAYYAAPYELVVRVLVIPGAVATAIFPAFAAGSGSASRAAANLYERGVKLIAVTLFPVSLVVALFSAEGLLLWMGPEMARRSTLVLQVLAIGVFYNGLAQVPFYLIQGAGRPSVAATLHLVELPLYLLGAWLLIERFGIVGAAVAWTVRVAVDAAVLFYLARNVDRGRAAALRPRLLAVLLAAAGVLTLSVLLSGTSLALRAAYTLGACTALGASFWLYLMEESERRILVEWRQLGVRRLLGRR